MARAQKKPVFTVNSAPGLNLRQSPTLDAPVLRVLKDGEKIEIDPAVEIEGWAAVSGGGFVMKKYIG